MPTIRVTTSVSFTGGEHYSAGDEVEVDAQRAQDAVSGGWGELVRQQVPETPEAAQTRAQGAPEVAQLPRSGRTQRRRR